MSGILGRVVAEASSPDQEQVIVKPKEYIPPPRPEVLRFEGKVTWHEIDTEDKDDDEDEDLEQESYMIETTYNALKEGKEARAKLWGGKAGDQSNLSSVGEVQTRSKPKKGQWLVLIRDGDGPEETCEICLEKVKHRASWCPYLTYVPKGKPVGHCAVVACKCCGIVGGHPGRDWIGCAIFR